MSPVSVTLQRTHGPAYLPTATTIYYLLLVDGGTDVRIIAWLILTLMAEINQNYSVRVHYQAVHRHRHSTTITTTTSIQPGSPVLGCRRRHQPPKARYSSRSLACTWRGGWQWLVTVFTLISWVSLQAAHLASMFLVDWICELLLPRWIARTPSSYLASCHRSIVVTTTTTAACSR